ncbi:hypothetical protein [Methanocella arvoryzae]|uniref:Uncharacterized protein n=1 Tax=Methanocella arvoryzae (strain DSM 22066 / NBRC 105507 / MRE50) TaxID=351160 RepID=Q0W854_METAR|nr:hypothetical protein [Methanocella arvoryzae]CAJ35439.1 hypothetical protein LRC493 [Methanocella arvoryzae MRE50]
MSMRKGWPVISIIVGMATLALIWYAFTIISSIDLSLSRMSWKLYELQGPGGHYYSALDTAGLFLLFFAVTILLCGILAALLSRPSGVSLIKGLYAPLLAASIPLAAIDLFLLLSYFNSTQQYYNDRIGSGPYPTEPPFLPVYLLIMAITTLPGVVLSIAGGLLVWWSVNDDNNKGV